MISKLAEELYAKTIQLKKYNSSNLIFKKNRLALEKELYIIREMTDIIIHKLNGNTDYSIQHYELSLFMSRAITECILCLTRKRSNYRNTVSRYICGIHNIPRAFLSTENVMKITVDEAISYYKPYLKLD